MPTLQNLGEQQVIRRLQQFITTRSEFSPNEDAYFHQLSNPSMVVNIDSMSKTTDFLPRQTWEQLGEKLVVITISDLAAKGAVPEIFLSSLVLESDMQYENLEELVRGIKQASEKYECLYLGGDLGSSSETVLVGCCIGHALNNKFLGRNLASPGDVVCVTGSFGMTGFGFQLELKGGIPGFDAFPDHIVSKALESIYGPRARVKEGLLLNHHNLATASIDSSDGLAASLKWLSELSNVKIIIDNPPVDPLLGELPVSEHVLLQWVMYGGEEYELVFTVKATEVDRLKSLFDKNKCSFQIIGKCVVGSGVFKDQDGKLEEIVLEGWDSFKSFK